MEVSKPMDLTRIEEIKILQNARLIYKHDLNPVVSHENIRVQFQISGDLQGSITCYLCIDGMDLYSSEKNFIYPLFTEAMNILLGRQLSVDPKLNKLKLQLSPPKINLNPLEINTNLRSMTQKYELELDSHFYQILTEYNLTALN
jgi:hypothetical protein